MTPAYSLWVMEYAAVPNYPQSGLIYGMHNQGTRKLPYCYIVIKGQGHIYSDLGEEPSVEGDVVYSPRGCWHGFNNTSNEDVVLVWGWMGAGSIEASGYEVDAESHS